MRPMSVLCRLGHLKSPMACLLYNTLSPLFGWLWRWLRPRFLRVTSYIVRSARLALGWTEDSGRRENFEISDDDDDPAVKSHPVIVTSPEDQQEPLGRVGVAGSLGWPAVQPTMPRRNATKPAERQRDQDEKYRVETTDELYCCYDSTWETEETQESMHRGPWGHGRPAAGSRRNYKFSRFESAARDMQNYRHDYPNGTPNLNFYLGHEPSVPDGVYIHTFHDVWLGDYQRLEYVHTYIQWLFPLQEPGMNYEASPLTKEEIQGFLENSIAKENLLKSYKLMLDFYGIELCDERTGKVKRAKNWKDRFNNLDTHSHNNLRITRILKCQGTLGYPHYQAPLVRFFLEETLVNGQLQSVKDSVLNYFVFAVLDKKERRSLIEYAYMNYDHKDEFVWCPKKIQMMWSKQF
ncbi:Opioid growth factor receptor [Collichthys lucidus]|uniref:Opioid growth factor receptor n=1 Tax=Collichthys lucidus TaxID=240159 RepID=A0A4U5UAR4_COLLU|nr:Opioid growth factor receptor [Collichthys lucidus]